MYNLVGTVGGRGPYSRWKTRVGPTGVTVVGTVRKPMNLVEGSEPDLNLGKVSLEQRVSVCEDITSKDRNK